MASKQIPALPPLDEAPADDDRFALRDTSSGSDKSLRVARLLERSQEQVAAHANRIDNPHNVTAAQVGAEPAGSVDDHAAETSTHGAPTGEDLLHSGDVGNEPNKLVKYEDDGAGGPRLPAADGSQLTGLGGVGEYKFVQEDLTGASVPDPDLWIKLEAGLTGAGEYNEGKLTNESVTGSAPLVEATAEIADADSPMNGQVVHLIETEERFLRAGQAGRVQNDQMQRLTGTIGGLRSGSTAESGVFSNPQSQVTNLQGGATATVSSLDFNSANSPNARTSSTTDGETRAKNIGVSVYLRIK